MFHNSIHDYYQDRPLTNEDEEDGLQSEERHRVKKDHNEGEDSVQMDRCGLFWGPAAVGSSARAASEGASEDATRCLRHTWGV